MNTYYGNTLKSFSIEKLHRHLSKKTKSLVNWRIRLFESLNNPIQDDFEAKEQSCARKMIDELSQGINELEFEIENRK
jgi:hypothetical protein